MKDKKEKQIKEKVKKENKPKRNIDYNIFKVNGKIEIIPLIVNILIPLGLGFIVGQLNRNSMAVYNGLQKSFLNPPAIVFPIVWTILYILMGIAAYRIYMINKSGKNDNGAYFYYLVQLGVNLLWPFVFFGFRLYGVSFVILLILLVLVIITTIKFFKVDKIAGILMIPYILWLIFAGVLNFFAYMLNEM